MSHRNATILALMLLALGAAPGAALAASSSTSGYDGVAGSVQRSIDPTSGHSSTPGPSSTGGSQLPFTGFDALALGGVGVLLAGLGITLRLLGRRTVRRRLELALAREQRLDPALERELVL